MTWRMQKMRLQTRTDLMFFSLPVTASIATTATKECIVSTDDACDTELEPDVKPVDLIPARTNEFNSVVVPNVCAYVVFRRSEERR